LTPAARWHVVTFVTKKPEKQLRSTEEFVRERYLRNVCVVAIGLAVLGGCGGHSKQYDISGTVTYQGQPIAEGQIVFVDAKGVEPASAGPIIGGTYHLRTTAGEKRIRITATRKTGEMLDDGNGARYSKRVDLIPPQYNTATKLTCTVDPRRELIFDFRLP
jgi:hypothetical protein